MKIKLSLRIIYLILLILFGTTFLLAVGMAYYAPYSGRAYVEYGVAPVFSKVTGTIEEIYCKDGDIVKKDDPLFRLDTRNYKAEVARLEALYETTANKLEALECQIREAEENISKQEKKCKKSRIDFERDQLLAGKQAISAKLFEDTQLQYEISLGELTALRKHREALIRERGSHGSNNSELKQLHAELDIARNHLYDAVIRAPISGTVSCHQLYCGQVIQTNEKYAVIHELNNLVVNADMMEKSVGRLYPGQSALIVFDAVPGQVFRGSLRGIVRELRSGYVPPTEFHQIEDDTRWIRAVGRLRVQCIPEDAMPAGTNLSSGSKAAVALVNPSHPFFSKLTQIWITAVSLLNYVY